MNKYLWQAEGAEAVDDTIMAFMAGEDIVLDRELFPFDIRATAAHVRGLQRAGILDEAESARLVELLEELAEAELVLVLRGDPTRTHPLVKTELVQRRRQDRQPVVLACAFPDDLARHADRTLTLRPGGDEALLHGLAHQIRETASRSKTIGVERDGLAREVSARPDKRADRVGG